MVAAGPGELHPVPGLHQVPRVVPAGPAGVPLPRVACVGSQTVDARTAFQHGRRLHSERVSAENTRQRKGPFTLTIAIANVTSQTDKFEKGDLPILCDIAKENFDLCKGSFTLGENER